MTLATIPGNRVAGRTSDGPDVHDQRDLTTGAVVGQVAGGGQDAAICAVESAATWVGRLSRDDRATVLRGVADHLRAAQGELADLVVDETGKRLAEAEAEVEFSARYFEVFANLGGDLVERRHEYRPGMTHVVTPTPVGVVAVLTPWNFPLSIPARKIAPAIAAGCGVVFKPSELSPRSGLRMAELVDEALGEAGLVNVVTGSPRTTVVPWLDHPALGSVTFTGSTRVGRVLGEQCGARGLRYTSELGGDAPFVMLPDADLAATVDLLAVAKYRNNGQSCIAANQVWVPQERLDEVADAFTATSRALRIGDPRDPSTGLGPLAPPTDPDRIAALAQRCADAGANVIEVGKPPAGEGHWAAPTVCVSTTREQPLVGEEIFGPLTQIAGYPELDHVRSQVARSPYGLAAYVVGPDVARADALAASFDVGISGVNTAGPNTPEVPFSGRRGSGLGYEGSRLGLEEFVAYQTRALVEPA